MTGASSLIRTLLTYSICVPLAIFLGYLMAMPLDYSTIIILALLLLLLMSPLLLRWHHVWLIASMNLGAVVVFAPGRPYLWLALAWISLILSIVHYILNPRHKFLRAPSVARPLLFLVVVVLVTAQLTGGIGLNTFGSEVMGGKKYIFLLSGVVAYFALVSQRIPPRRAHLYVALFFLGSITTAIGELPGLVGPSFYFIFMLFPATSTGVQSVSDNVGIGGRLEGFGATGAAVVYWMLCRYGLQGIFSFRSLGRLLIFVGFLALSMLAGFRSVFILFALTFGILFYLEGLMRSRMLPLLVIGFILCGTLVTSFSDHMPFGVQRALSFLPLKIDPVIRASAENSSEWRLKIWRDVLPEVPDHLLLGKGYALSAKDLARVAMTESRAGDSGVAGTELAGDYHNGPLSIILPFGIFGVLAFLWFLWASLRVMYSNFRFGIPPFRNMNRFLLAYFIAKAVSFFLIFGSLNSDLVTFTGLVALSISLNGGVAKAALVPQPKIRLHAFRLHPALRKPASVQS